MCQLIASGVDLHLERFGVQTLLLDRLIHQD